jgi:uncharacterized protein
MLVIEFDRGKNMANVAKHGVHMAAAAEFDFETAETWTDTRESYGEVRTIALGFITNRLHVLVFTMRGPEVAGYKLAQSKSQRKGCLSCQKIKDHDKSARKIGTLLIHRH